MFAEARYLRWLREALAQARYSLAASGAPPAEDLLAEAPPVDLADVLGARSGAGSARLEAATARRYGVPESCVLTTLGTTGGLLHVLATLARPEEPVVVERPTYGPLRQMVEGLGLRVVELERPGSEGFLPDPGDLRRLLASGARLVVLTDPHNPSGVCLPEAVFDALCREAEAHGALLVVDEVYRELTPWPATSRFAPEAPVVALGSLTKAWGLGALRAGWILARPEVRARLEASRDFFWPDGVEPAASVAATVLEGDLSERLLTRAWSHLGRVWPRVEGLLRGRPGWTRPDAPCLTFLDLGRPATPVAEALLAQTGTLVVPGEHFGAPDGVRIACFAPEAEIETGLSRLGRVLAGLE